MYLIQFRLTLSFSTSSMADLRSFSTKEFYWLASCFWGIITCKLVYDIKGFISPFCSKGYGKLSDKEKVEGNNRGFSTFHALITAWASLYLLLFSDLFEEDSSNDLIVDRSSIISNMILGVDEMLRHASVSSVARLLSTLRSHDQISSIFWLLHSDLHEARVTAVLDGCP